jgi:hypothetical protein
MMTPREFKTLKAGTLATWREGMKSPRAGEITEVGIVTVIGSRHFVKWPDGQETDGSDDWALQSVEVPPPTEAI